MSEPTKKLIKRLYPYKVRVRVIGEWWENWEVEAVDSSEAWDNWRDGEKQNDNPIAPDALEWEVDEVKRGDYWGYDDDEYDDDDCRE